MTSRRPCWRSKQRKRRPCWRSEMFFLGFELYFYANSSFCFIMQIWLLITWANTLYRPFSLAILFSQYESCDNTQEDWSFVLLHSSTNILMNKRKDRTSWVLAHDLYWEKNVQAKKVKRSIDYGEYVIWKLRVYRVCFACHANTSKFEFPAQMNQVRQTPCLLPLQTYFFHG